MGWGLATMAIVLLAVLAGILQRKQAAGRQTKGSRRHIQVNYGKDSVWRAAPRPATYSGPTPAELLDGWGEFEDHAKLQWWQFEHLVAEFLRREHFDDVVVRGTDLDDKGVDVDAQWGLAKVAIQAKHYGSNLYAAKDEILKCSRADANAGAVRGYFFTTGAIGKNSYMAAKNAAPPVYAVDGQSLWKMVQAQRAGKPTGLSRPTKTLNVTARGKGCLFALFTLGLVR